LSDFDQLSQTFAPKMPSLNRRSFLIGSIGAVGALGLAGCTTMRARAQFSENYPAMPNERFPIPAVDISQIDAKYLRQVVRYDSTEPVGTIIVDTPHYYLYRIEGDGYATRYGVSVGATAFLWSGEAYIGRKAEWAVWTPTPAQIGRDPTLVQYAGGMPPGLNNPLGARTLYLYQNGAYTLFTIYGTVHTEIIGVNFGSGCIGLLSQDIIHLYERTPVGTNVIVLPA
jgi:lipoprotein-anchoring transpeptidase ErfK/SrfK